MPPMRLVVEKPSLKYQALTCKNNTVKAAFTVTLN